MTALQTDKRTESATPGVAVIGGGPAGLMAAEVMAKAGIRVEIFDAMPSVGRKFLLAGRGGLNLTHSEPLERFVTRYAERAPVVASWLERFSPDDMKAFGRPGWGSRPLSAAAAGCFPCK
jgi:predicted flavoprotein YhiN